MVFPFRPQITINSTGKRITFRLCFTMKNMGLGLHFMHTGCPRAPFVDQRVLLGGHAVTPIF